MEQRRLLTERFPWLYPVSVECHRAARRMSRLARRTRHARIDPTVETPHLVARHSSIVLRRLAGVDMKLQENKRRNLELAVPTIDGRVLRPGEQLSLWTCVGKPSARRGYLPGLVLYSDHLATEVGGGLCQLSNLLYWLVLHSPLEVVEHHHHGVDVFPDSGRVLPFGSGATIFYNYLDLVVSNPTPDDYRLRLSLTPDELCGEIWASRLPADSYHVRESGHRFLMVDGRLCRENWLHRQRVDRRTGKVIDSTLIAHNLSPVLYEVDPQTLAEARRAS